MKKIKLDLDALSVDSFATSTETEGRGTVQAHRPPWTEGIECESIEWCEPGTGYSDCDCGTNPTNCGTCATNCGTCYDATCGNTYCGTCDPYCCCSCSCC